MPFTSDGIIASLVSAVVGWLAASVTKVSKADHKELLQRVAVLEKDLTSRMTRSEFVEAFGEVKALMRQFQLEARAEFKELKSELKTKT
jgi:hypothetical protein